MVNKRNGNNNSGLTILLYLLLSVFSALIFSLLYKRSINEGRTSTIWFILTTICAFFYGTIAMSLIITSSASHDAGYYYLGIITFASNGLALLILILKLFK